MTFNNPTRAGEPIPVMDLHSDIILRMISNGVDIGNPPAWPQVTIPTMREGHVTDQVFAVWVDSDDNKGLEATRRAARMIDLFEQAVEKYPDDLAIVTTVDEAESAVAEGKVASWLWIEGGAPIDNDIALLRTFYRLGVRGMTLTWTKNLDWAGSSTDKVNPDMGLTDLGRDIVREMNRLGMIVDLSHVSDRTFYEVLEMTTDPVVVSHSCVREICGHARNIDDDMLRALAKNGGVIGINALPEYLQDNWAEGWEAAEAAHEDEVKAILEKTGGDRRNPDYREARRVLLQENLPEESIVDIGVYVDHIEHAIEVAGVEHVALGADFDGMWAFPVGLEKASKWQNVVAELRKRGHSDETIKAVFRDNARRVFRQVLDE